MANVTMVIVTGEEGSFRIEVICEGHHFVYSERHFECCGEWGKDFSCSCGFTTRNREGKGCWQHGHEFAAEAELDLVHATLLLEGIAEMILQDVGYPALWQSLMAEVLRSL